MLSTPRHRVGSGGSFAGEVVAWWRSVYVDAIASVLYDSLHPTVLTVFSHINPLRGVAAVSATLSFGDVLVAGRLGVNPDRQWAGSTAPFLFFIYFCPSLFPDWCAWYPLGVFCTAVRLASLPLCLRHPSLGSPRREVELSRAVPGPSRASVASRGLGCRGCALQSPLLKSSTPISARLFSALQNSAVF